MTGCANFFEKIIIFIVMDNGNARPPACRAQEIRTGNYYLIWSGLIRKKWSGHFVFVAILENAREGMLDFQKGDGGGNVNERTFARERSRRARER